jgi:acetyl-CoA synthetase (ADP-forming)
MGIIDEAVSRGQKALSEYEAKKFLSEHGVIVTREELVKSVDEAKEAAERLGYPVVIKACGPDISHKTERSLVKVKIETPEALEKAYREIENNLKGDPYDGMLIQEMVEGEREFVIGLIRDPQFGPCVMFGLGGIFTEVLKDTSFRVAPIEKYDALQMMEEIRAKDLLGPFRGKPPVNKDLLAQSLIAVGEIGMKYDHVREIDINPVIISGDRPVAVDALVVLGTVE